LSGKKGGEPQKLSIWVDKKGGEKERGERKEGKKTRLGPFSIFTKKKRKQGGEEGAFPRRGGKRKGGRGREEKSESPSLFPLREGD